MEPPLIPQRHLTKAQRRLRTLLDRWPTYVALARDLAAFTDPPVSYQAVASWVRRGSIPTRHFDAVLASAARYGISLDRDRLTRIAGRRAPRSRVSSPPLPTRRKPHNEQRLDLAA